MLGYPRQKHTVKKSSTQFKIQIQMQSKQNDFL